MTNLSNYHGSVVENTFWNWLKISETEHEMNKWSKQWKLFYKSLSTLDFNIQGYFKVGTGKGQCLEKKRKAKK